MLPRRPLYRVLLVLLLIATPRICEAAKGVRAPNFSPTGVATDVRQVTARFDAPMVRLGEVTNPPVPFDRVCSASGQATWVDSRTWTLNFDQTLPAGLECHFTLRDGLLTLAGDPVEGGKKFSFSTGGPRISSSNPSAGTVITEDAAFVLHLNGAVADESVEEHAFFNVEGIGERVGVRILSAEERSLILRNLPPVPPRLTPIILQARQIFPPDAKVELVWNKAIEAPSGQTSSQDQRLDFQVRKAFHATFHCQREKAQGPCDPLRPVRVKFSSPVARKIALDTVVVQPDSDFRLAARPGRGRPELTSEIHFPAALPPSTQLELRMPTELRDAAGRPLENASRFPLTFTTGLEPPLAKFAARFGILEANPGAALPVTVRSVGTELQAQILAATPTMEGRVSRVEAGRPSDIVPWLRRVRDARRDRSLFPAGKASKDESTLPKEITIPIPGEANQTEVLGIPLARPGLYVVEIENKELGRALLGKRKPMYVSAAALVTNLSVHLKHGLENSIAWVTTLDQANPVAGAEVQAFDCSGALVATAITDQEGLARLQGVPPVGELPRCQAKKRVDAAPWRNWRASNRALDGLDQGLFVTARHGDDLSFVFSSWDRGIEPWRFGLYSRFWGRSEGIHTIFGRELVRAGETIHMKHVLRLETVDGFALAAKEALPGIVSLRHSGSDGRIDLPLHWKADGSAITTWKIPASAKLGEYEVFLQTAPAVDSPAALGAEEERPADDIEIYRPAPAKLGGWAGSFQVEEFRTPLMHAVIKLPALPQVAPDEVPVDIALRYLTGGGAANTPVLLRSQLSDTSIDSPRQFRSMTFGNGTVVTGVARRRVGNPPPDPVPPVHQKTEVELDDQGTARTTISGLARATRPQKLTAEVEFRDPNGETQTASTSVPLWPADQIPGFRSRIGSGRRASF